MLPASVVVELVPGVVTVVGNVGLVGAAVGGVIGVGVVCTTGSATVTITES